MQRASEAPFVLVDIVYCLKSWTIIDAGRDSLCSPVNDHPGEDVVVRSHHNQQEVDDKVVNRAAG